MNVAYFYTDALQVALISSDIATLAQQMPKFIISQIKGLSHA